MDNIKNLKFKIVNLKFAELPAAKIFIFHFVIFYLFIAGCRNIQKQACPAIAGLAEGKQILADYAASIKPVKATGECSINYVNENGEKFGQSFPVRMWYLNPEKFCFYGDVAFDPQGIGFAADEGRYWAYIKPMGVNVSGYVNAAEDNFFSNPSLLVDFVRCPEEDCDKPSLAKNIIICREQKSARQKKIFINSCDRVAEKIEYFTKASRPVLVIKAEKYEKVEGGQFLFPHKLRYEYFDRKNGRNEMQLKFDSVKLWQPKEQQVKALFRQPAEKLKTKSEK